MTWLAWRQHRLSILAGIGLLGALAVFLVLTGLSMRGIYADLGLDRCAAPVSSTCPEAVSRFSRRVEGYQFSVVPLLLILPVLAGMFWGAPLVAREVEQGTHRLAWTQSVTRNRWLLAKVGLLALVGAGLLTAATALLAWWTGPLASVRPERFGNGLFDLVGVVPIAYGLTALAIGVTAGTLTRRTLPAIALTLVAFLGVRVGIELVLRPRYMTPVTVTLPFTVTDGRPDFPGLPSDIGWTQTLETRDAQGRVLGDGVGFEFPAVVEVCPEVSPGAGPSSAARLADCIARNGVYVLAVYQPADRYWRFQLTEAAIYACLSIGLLGTSAWWVRHRIS